MFDYSTINIAKIISFREYTLPYGYTVSNPGSGCFLDAPGYPSYFLRSVYNSHGNTPFNGPEYVIGSPNGAYYIVPIEDYGDRGKVLQDLWVPIAYNPHHPRIAAFENYAYAYFKTGYVDPAKGWGTASDLVFYKPNENALAIPENHAAAIWIQEFYPEHQPNSEYINNPPPWGKNQSDWWTRHSKPQA